MERTIEGEGWERERRGGGGGGGERWRDGEDNRGRVMGEGEEGRWRGREGRDGEMERTIGGE